MSEVLNIPDGWVETTLGNSINLIGGGTPNTSTPEYWGGEIPWLSVVDFNDDNRWVYSAEKSITELGLKKSSTKLLNIGDIIISARGTVGAMAQLKNKMAFNQSCYGIKEKENITDINFIFYLLKFSLKQISRNTYGAVFDTITTKTFDIIKIILPTLLEQKAIAAILTSFDDKIELLQAQNKTLEETAQTIYAEWFGRYSIEDELPDGWRVGKLEKIIKYIIDNRGKTPPTIDSKTEGYPLIEVNSITGNDRNININVVRKFVDNDTYENWFRKGHPIKGDILISTVGSIGQLGQVYDEKICIAQNIVALRSTISGNFLYELLKFNQKEIISIDISSVQPSIKVPHLLNIEIIIPDEKTIHKFDTTVNSLTNKLFENYKQINMLTKNREEILPKLLSGEIRIKNN